MYGHREIHAESRFGPRAVDWDIGRIHRGSKGFIGDSGFLNYEGRRGTAVRGSTRFIAPRC